MSEQQLAQLARWQVDEHVFAPPLVEASNFGRIPTSSRFAKNGEQVWVEGFCRERVNFIANWARSDDEIEAAFKKWIKTPGRRPHKKFEHWKTTRPFCEIKREFPEQCLSRRLQPGSETNMSTLISRRPQINDLARARAHIAKVPGAIEGHGGDKTTFALACKLVKDLGLSGNDAFSVMREWNHTCRPPWREQEIARKIRCAGQPVPSAGASHGFKKWPDIDNRLVAKAIRNGVNLARLEEMNPCKLDGDGPHSERIIDFLHPGNPLMCFGTNAYTFETKPREEWRGAESRQAYLVPSAMSAIWGVTEDGNPSQRTKTNVGPRQYVVTEFDQES